MIDWLYQQTVLATSLVLLLVVMRYVLLPQISAFTWYIAWLTLPVTLLLNTFVDPTIYVSEVSRFTIVPVSSSVMAAYSSVYDPLLLLWGAGACVVLLYALFSHLAFVSRIAGYSAAKCNMEQVKAGNGQEFRVIKTSQCNVPYVCGFFNPVIVIPHDFEIQFNGKQQVLILRHENIHRKRRDPLWNLLAQAVVAILWFNPLVWFGYKLFREAQELSCDEAVLTNEDVSSRAEYARALLRASLSHFHAFNVISYGHKTLLKERLKRVMCHTSAGSLKDIFVLGTLSLLTLGSSLVFASAGHSDGPRLTPIMRIAPTYPAHALEKGVEGSISLSFDIDTDGRVGNVFVVDSTLSEAFEQAARLAIQQWRYEKPQSKVNNVKVALDFIHDAQELNNSPGSADASVERIIVSNKS